MPTINKSTFLSISVLLCYDLSKGGIYFMNENKTAKEQDFNPEWERNITNHSGQNIFLLIITGLLIATLFFTYRTYQNSCKNWGSLEHYDSLYSERQDHIRLNQNGEVYIYTTPNGETYYLHDPVPSDKFYHPELFE